MADSDIKVVGLSSSKSGGKTNWKIISAIIGIVVLSIGIVAGIILVRQNQNINEQASCSAECPGNDGMLRSCVGTTGNDTNDSECNASLTGRVEVCGQNNSTARQFCCSGGSWSTNLTGCARASTPTATASPTASPTIRATSTATSTSSSSPTKTATATATAKGTATATSTSKATATSTSKATSTAKGTVTAKATATATAFPVPETGVSLPTMLGTGFGIVMILLSLGLAL
jgi:septal ring-binding cell division protein DamX